MWYIFLSPSVNDHFDNLVTHTDVVVSEDGSCLWVPGGIFQSSCRIDPTWFPYDSQICHLKFGSWTYDGGKVDLTIQGNSGDSSSYLSNSEWELTGSREYTVINIDL